MKNKFSKNEFKNLIIEMHRGYYKYDKNKYNNILYKINNNIDGYKIIYNNQIKLAVRISEENDFIVVDYAYIKPNKRKKGHYKNIMDKLSKQYKYVLYEPSLSWFLNNINKTEYPLIQNIKFLNEEEREYFIWGSKKDNELINIPEIPKNLNLKLKLLCILTKGDGVSRTYLTAKLIKEEFENLKPSEVFNILDTEFKNLKL